MSKRSRFAIRGRQLLLLDAALVVVVFAGLSVMTGERGGLAEALPILFVARMLALARSGTYQHARSLADPSDLIRISSWIGVASLVGYVIDWLVLRSLGVGFAVAETATVLLVLIGLRVVLEIGRASCRERVCRCGW